MKQVGVFAVLLDALRTPSIQVLVFGTGFLLCMLFVYMGVLIPMDNNLYALLSEVGNAAPWRQALLQDATVLGNLSVLLFVTVSVAMALLLAGEQRKALTFVCAVVIGLAVTFLLQAGIARPRPPLADHTATLYDHSFPSTHTTLSTLVYFYIAYLLNHFTKNWAVRLWVYLVAAILVMTIGISKVMLGMHWPSDVVAGWCAGGSMAALSFYVIKWKRKLRVKTS